MTRDALVELREKVRLAKAPDREIDLALGALWPEPPFSMSIRQQRGGKPPVFEFTASIDSALALVERLGLPWIVILREAYQLCSADLKRLPKAIIEAVLSALIEQEPHHGTD